MGQQLGTILPALPVMVLLAAGSISRVPRQGQSGERTATPALATIACRVLESHASLERGVTAVVFHHRDTQDQARLASLLREHSGAAVEVQTADGNWQKATLFRLKSCFGRGLLLLPAGAAHLSEKDTFLLRVRP